MLLFIRSSQLLVLLKRWWMKTKDQIKIITIFNSYNSENPFEAIFISILYGVFSIYISNVAR